MFVSFQFGLMRTHGLKGNSRKRRCSACRQSTAQQCKQQRSCTGRSFAAERDGDTDAKADPMAAAEAQALKQSS